jgi:cell division protein ZapD
VRTLLRLEFLFEQGGFALGGSTTWHSRLGVQTLLDIQALLSRGDLRSDIQKEIERLTGSLDALRSKRGVDAGRLDAVLEECHDLLERLRSAPPGIPGELRGNEFLANVAQRAGILGGTCGFDLPGYQLWLHADPAARQQDLERWFGALGDLQEATQLILRLLRDSADPTREVARDGTYQTTLDRDTPYQLLRVSLPPGTRCFPEVSGSRHFCTIRFMVQPDLHERAQPLQEDVEFRFERCVI